MHPIKRTLALMLTLSLSVSCLPSAVLAVEEPAAATAEVSASTDVTLTAEETPAVTADDLPEQTPTAGNAPVTDAQVQQALETFDPTIDDPQYRKEYSRYQQSKEEGDIALAAMDSGPELMSASNPYTRKKYTHTHAKTKYIYYGIDVSQWQGTINWKKVKADGISFVFIRCSYTSLKSFNLHTDPKFKANVTAAAAAGLKVGVYHYSGATSATEAKKEANYVVNLLKPYKSKITLPVMFDYEPGERVTANYKKTSKTTRTKYATTFCNAAKAAGYTSGVYCSTSWFPTYFNVSSLSGYSNWDAQWASKNTYTGAYDFWQYSDSGKISGISGSVDCNFWYTNTKISGSTTTGGSTGTVPDSDPTPEAASTALTAPHVTNAAVNYRMAAGTSGTLAGTLPKGTVIDLVYGYHKTVNGAKWYKFNYNGHAYYIHEDYVDREVLQHHTAAKALRYHTSASASAAVKGTFASGDSVQVVQGGSQTADGAQWHKVKVGSSYYYAAAKHLTPAETFVDSAAKKNVNVRTKAGTSQTKAAYLYAGTPVTVVNGKSVAVSGERWEQVKIGSKYYYILGSYLTKASSSKALTAANTTVVLEIHLHPLHRQGTETGCDRDLQRRHAGQGHRLHRVLLRQQGTGHRYGEDHRPGQLQRFPVQDLPDHRPHRLLCDHRQDQLPLRRRHQVRFQGQSSQGQAGGSGLWLVSDRQRAEVVQGQDRRQVLLHDGQISDPGDAGEVHHHRQGHLSFRRWHQVRRQGHPGQGQCGADRQGLEQEGQRVHLVQAAHQEQLLLHRLLQPEKGGEGEDVQHQIQGQPPFWRRHQPCHRCHAGG